MIKGIPGSPAETLAQLAYTFGLGITLAVLRLGTHTIWLVVLAHGLLDVTSASFVDPDATNTSSLLWAVTVLILGLGAVCWWWLRGNRSRAGFA